MLLITESEVVFKLSKSTASTKGSTGLEVGMICSPSESLESFCSSSTCAGRGEGGAGLVGRSGGLLGEGCTRCGLLAAKIFP
jgi:hypothetical protein